MCSKTRHLPVSICSLCFPSDNEAIREPMKTYKRNLGKLQIVAAMNCQTDTDCIDLQATVSTPTMQGRR
jgi:hypothetical protein